MTSSGFRRTIADAAPWWGGRSPETLLSREKSGPRDAHVHRSILEEEPLLPCPAERRPVGVGGADVRASGIEVSVEMHERDLAMPRCIARHKGSAIVWSPEREQRSRAFHHLLGGRGLVGYMAFDRHHSFFPMSPAAVDAHRDELGDLVTGKGTISFDYARPLPVTLVKKVVKTRLAEVAGKR
jgi:hypothetical protein